MCNPYIRCRKFEFVENETLTLESGPNRPGKRREQKQNEKKQKRENAYTQNNSTFEFEGIG